MRSSNNGSQEERCWPAVILHSRPEQDFVTVAKALAGVRRASGFPFACINIFGMHDEKPWELPAHGFNPLDFLDPGSPAFAADALVFAEMLTPRTGGESGSSAYFKDAAQTAKRAMLVHIKTAEPQDRQNIATLYEYARNIRRSDPPVRDR